MADTKEKEEIFLPDSGEEWRRSGTRPTDNRRRVLLVSPEEAPRLRHSSPPPLDRAGDHRFSRPRGLPLSNLLRAVHLSGKMVGAEEAKQEKPGSHSPKARSAQEEETDWENGHRVAHQETKRGRRQKFSIS